MAPRRNKKRAPVALAAQQRTKAKKGPPPTPPLHANPIDVLELLQTTLLCCNRVFQERGISRIVAGFHKDLLRDDISTRLEYIDGLVPGYSHVYEGSEKRAMEYTHFMKYYVNDEEIFHQTLFSLCYLIDASNWTSTNIGIMVEESLDIIMRCALLHPGVDTIDLILDFVDELLSSPGARWRSRMTDRFLDLGGAEILQFSNRLTRDDFDSVKLITCSWVMESLIEHLESRPRGSHHGLAGKLQESLDMLEGRT
jgi:hypothetical protein